MTKRHTILLALTAAALAVSGCKLSLDGKDLNKSEGGDSSGDRADSHRWKDAIKHRPDNHPKGAPWWELHVDSTPSNNATRLQASCDAPEKENGVCNGLDDDCDGQVDEECGVENGGLQISMAWETYNSMDLWLQYRSWDDFRSKELTYNSYGPNQISEIALGEGSDAPILRLGPDGKGNCACEAKKIVNDKILTCGPGCSEKRGRCVPDDGNQFSEWAALKGGEAPPGIYEIKFHNNSQCGTRGPETAVTLSVSEGGKLVGSFKSGLLQTQSSNFPIMKIYVP